MVRVLEQEGAGAYLIAQVIQIILSDKLVCIEEDLVAPQIRPCLQGSLAFYQVSGGRLGLGTDVLRRIADFTLIGRVHFHGGSVILFEGWDPATLELAGMMLGM